MDRALNLSDVELALGDHSEGALPTGEQLVDMIANVEIRAFMRDREIDDELVRTAWYLHGVASAGGDFYSTQRRNRAFAVSAHIFDLALERLERSRDERLSLALGAQIGYRRAELDPNASAIYRRVAALLRDDDDVVDHIKTLSVEAAVGLLGLDTPQLLRLLRTWRRQLGSLANDVQIDTLDSTLFGPAQQIVLGVSAILSYLTFGGPGQLDIARASFVRVLNGEAGSGDLNARWVAGHLLPLVDDLEGGSVRALLPPDTPPVVARAFCLSEPSVLTLWPPQRELLERQPGNPLDPATQHLLLSVPTSAGKTLLAQLVICTHLATRPGGVCYVSPLRSLGREMRQALSGRLRVLDRELGRDLPDSGDADLLSLFDIVEDEPPDVEITTPERLMQLLRRDPVDVLARFSLFVIDEMHLIGQQGRGFTLESLLAFLNSQDKSPRIVLLSGVLGNAASLASWVAPGEPSVLFTSDWRGPRRLHALLNTRALWEQSTRTPRRSTEWPVRITTPLAAQLRLRPAESAAVTVLTTGSETPIGTLVRKENADGTTRQMDDGGTPSYKMFASAAGLLTHAGSLLMIVSTRRLARLAARAMADELPATNRTRDLAEFLEERLGAEHTLVHCARRGVAYHHAALPLDVQEAIEENIRAGQLTAVVSTSTLTDGVNLPVRTVVIAETPGQTGAPQLDASRLLNAIGRAGRAGRETEGWIVLALQKKAEDSDFELLRPSQEALEAQSTLTHDDATAALAQAEELVAATADGLLRVPPGLASDFIGYCWFLSHAMQELQKPLTSADLTAALENLLGFQQLDPALKQRWVSLATRSFDDYVATDPGRRRRWLAAGTSLGSAATLDGLAERVAADMLAQQSGDASGDLVEWPLEATIDLLARYQIPERLLELPEAEGSWRFAAKLNGQGRLDVPVLPILRLWLAGADMPALANAAMPTVPAEWALEQIVTAISTTFEHYLSWTLGVLTANINEILQAASASVRLREDVAWCIRYGVDTPHALDLLTSGVRSRRLAYTVGRHAADDGVLLADLRQWLATLHIDGWRTRFTASPRETLDLLQFTRARRSSLLRPLLEVGRAELELSIPDATDDDNAQVVTVAQVEAFGPFAVVAADGRELATIPATLHADVDAVLSSGLEVDIELRASRLEFLAREFTS